MNFEAGWILVSRDAAKDPGVWFIFHHDDEGSIGIDISTAHPRIGYKGFESVLNFTDPRTELEKIVLLGGSDRPDDALIILHETSAAMDDSHTINDDFSFMSYNYVVLPGKPPSVTTPGNQPTQIKLKKNSAFLIAMGYRVWDSGAIEEEIEASCWICLPAAADVVFNISHSDRRAKILKQVN